MSPFAASECDCVVIGDCPICAPCDCEDPSVDVDAYGTAHCRDCGRDLPEEEEGG